jgi:nuclear transcription factor Y gamma
MIAAEAPVLFAKACEMFILELTLRSWIHTEENKRRTLQRNDIAGAITRGDIFDFLVDIVPRDELKDEDLAVPWPGVPGEPVPYGNMYYPPIPGQPMHHPMVTPEMMVGQPAIAQNPQMMYQPPQVTKISWRVITKPSMLCVERNNVYFVHRERMFLCSQG